MVLRRPRALVLWLLGSLVLCRAAPNLQAARLDEPEELSPGLIAEYSPNVAKGPAIARVVPDLVGRWHDGSPDPRIPAADFTARWTGFLLIQAPGKYQFRARTDGKVSLKVADRLALSGTGDSAVGERVELPTGFVPIVFEYRHSRGESQVAVDWESPSFRREPVPARLLFHDAALRGPNDLFEQGRQLADRLGCANCHSVLDLRAHPNLGPPLDGAGRAIRPAWLSAWLTDPSRLRAGSRMPAFGNGLSPIEVGDLRAFLLSRGPSNPPSSEIRMALNVASAAKGQLLFRSIGCLACHTRGAGEAGGNRSSGPDLSGLAGKRELPWLASYLVHPRGRVASEHRADMRLSPDESADLAAYLVAEPPAAPLGEFVATGSTERGRALFERFRCAACHELRGFPAPPADLKLTAASRVGSGCLAKTASALTVPRFNLSDTERAALQAFVSQLPEKPSRTAPETIARDQIRRRNCFGCHSREGEGGPILGNELAALLKSDPALGALKGSLTPPNLSTVGDKLRPEYLADAVRGKAPTARPWLAVRMPSFAFEPREVESVVEFFQGHDRMLADADRPEVGEPLAPATVDATARLIGQKGFGCVSCHVVAGRIPPGGEPETLGPDLALAHRRLSERYFRRWVENPQRIIAGTSMPQFIKPVETVSGTLDEQLAMIWRLLASPRAAEVALSGTKEFLKRQGERALVVFDMVLVPGAPATPYTPRGVAIGLKNDQTLLFDADRLCWLAWWQQGFLSRTKSGRLWEWHPEGARLWTASERRAPVVFIAPDGSVKNPSEVRERFGHLTSLDFDGAGVALSYSLNAPGGGSASVTERIRPRGSGWEREVEVSGVPPGLQPAILEAPSGPKSGAGIFSWTVDGIRVTLQVDGAQAITAPGFREKDGTLFALDHKDERSYQGRVRLSTERAP